VTPGRGGRSYDLVLLDADGTILDFEAASEAAFRGTAAEAGLEAGPAPTEALFARYRAINHGIWEELERGEIDKEALKTERFRRLFAEFGIGADPAAFSARFLDRLSEGSQLLPGAEDFVRSLTDAGKRLAIVTNGISAVQRGRFARSPFASLIPDLLISEELGAGSRTPSSSLKPSDDSAVPHPRRPASRWSATLGAPTWPAPSASAWTRSGSTRRASRCQKRARVFP
jgi:2-haloacid dehalogenase